MTYRRGLTIAGIVLFALLLGALKLAEAFDLAEEA